MKRSANLNTTNGATKHSKVSKLPVVKPDIGTISRTAKSAIPSASASKLSQSTQPGNQIRRILNSCINVEEYEFISS